MNPAFTLEDIKGETGKVLELVNQVEDKLAPFDRFRITQESNIPAPTPIITIAGETICTAGNVTTISGASKSGKSAFTGILMAGAISENGELDGLEGVHVEPNSTHRAVIHIDTEQAKHKHKRNLASISKRAGYQSIPEWLLSYNIREADVSECAAITNGICEGAAKSFGGIHSIFIDGLADYISDVNEADEANAIIKFVEELAIKYNCPVITIVHTNPGSDKERGHLGSQLQRKSESVLIVKTEGDISYIEPKFLREAGKGNIPKVQFTYDPGKGYHVGCGVRQAQAESKDAIRLAEIKRVCELSFPAQSALKYGEALGAIMLHASKAERTAKDYLREMQVHFGVTQGPDKLWRRAI